MLGAESAVRPLMAGVLAEEVAATVWVGVCFGVGVERASTGRALAAGVSVETVEAVSLPAAAGDVFETRLPEAGTFAGVVSATAAADVALAAGAGVALARGAGVVFVTRVSAVRDFAGEDPAVIEGGVGLASGAGVLFGAGVVFARRAPSGADLDGGISGGFVFAGAGESAVRVSAEPGLAAGRGVATD